MPQPLAPCPDSLVGNRGTGFCVDGARRRAGSRSTNGSGEVRTPCGGSDDPTPSAVALLVTTQDARTPVSPSTPWPAVRPRRIQLQAGPLPLNAPRPGYRPGAPRPASIAARFLNRRTTHAAPHTPLRTRRAAPRRSGHAAPDTSPPDTSPPDLSALRPPFVPSSAGFRQLRSRRSLAGAPQPKLPRRSSRLAHPRRPHFRQRLGIHPSLA